MARDVTAARKVATLASAVAVFALSVGLAEAYPARVLKSTNLRQGPGTTYGITITVPGGSTVEISQCAGEWCTAHWRGRIGYMIASNIAPGGPVAPPPGPPVGIYDEPPLVYGPPIHYGPRYYWGPRYYRRRW